MYVLMYVQPKKSSDIKKKKKEKKLTIRNFVILTYNRINYHCMT